MMVFDRKDYLEKAKNLLEQSAYRELTSDPTSKYEANQITILKRIKRELRMDDNTYKCIYPTWASCPKFYGLPKKSTKRTLSFDQSYEAGIQ